NKQKESCRDTRLLLSFITSLLLLSGKFANTSPCCKQRLSVCSNFLCSTFFAIARARENYIRNSFIGTAGFGAGIYSQVIGQCYRALAQVVVWPFVSKNSIAYFTVSSVVYGCKVAQLGSSCFFQIRRQHNIWN